MTSPPVGSEQQRDEDELGPPSSSTYYPEPSEVLRSQEGDNMFDENQGGEHGSGGEHGLPSSSPAYSLEPSEVPCSRQGEEDDNNDDEDEEQASSRNLMAKAMERGGIVGWTSYLTFHWAGRLLKLGSTSATLNGEDLDGIYKNHRSQYLCDILRGNWERELAKMGENADKSRGMRKGMALLRALLVTYRGRLALSGVLLMAENASMILQAVALGWLIGCFEDENAPGWQGWVYAFAVVASGIASSSFYQHLFFIGEVLGMQTRVSTTTLLYDKILRLRLSSLGEVTAGHLVNLATSDVERFQFCAMFVNYLWGSPLLALVNLAVGLHVVGVSFLVGFAAMFMLIPVQGFFSRKFATVRQRVTALTDERVKLTNQVITGARVMKLNAWEPALENEIRRVRAEEIRVLMKATLLRAMNEAMFFVQPVVLGCLVFVTYHLLDSELTPSKVFTTLALLNNTQYSMGRFFARAVQSASECWVSIKRMESVLVMEEKESVVTLVSHGATIPAPDAGGIRCPRINPSAAEAPSDIAAANATATTTPLSTLPSTDRFDTPVTPSLSAAPVPFQNDGKAPATQTATANARTTTKNARVGSDVNGGGEASEASDMRTPVRGTTPHDTIVRATNGCTAVSGSTSYDPPVPTTNGRTPNSTTGDATMVEQQRRQHSGLSSEQGSSRGGLGHVGYDASRNRRGFIFMKGACFSWTKGRADNDETDLLHVSATAPMETSSNREGSRSSGDSNRLEMQEEETGAGLVLDDINLEIEPGMLVGVVGPVGSSKSSLLMAVLREIDPEREDGVGSPGTTPTRDQVHNHATTKVVSVGGAVAYASQEPWIQSGTLRENILFGRRMDRDRYESVLRDCSLERDMSILPSGDMTGIGDRGINISGGQKARVGLARMAYEKADVYLMDDPLSAVDPAVGRELFSRVVCGRLSGSTRLLVTHQVHYLNDPAVDVIIVMDHGKIIARGSYDELERSGILARLGRPVSPSANVLKRTEGIRDPGKHYMPSPSATLDCTISSPSQPLRAENALDSSVRGSHTSYVSTRQQQYERQHRNDYRHQHHQNETNKHQQQQKNHQQHQQLHHQTKQRGLPHEHQQTDKQQEYDPRHAPGEKQQAVTAAADGQHEPPGGVSDSGSADNDMNGAGSNTNHADRGLFSLLEQKNGIVEHPLSHPGSQGTVSAIARANSAWLSAKGMFSPLSLLSAPSPAASTIHHWELATPSCGAVEKKEEQAAENQEQDLPIDSGEAVGRATAAPIDGTKTTKSSMPCLSRPTTPGSAALSCREHTSACHVAVVEVNEETTAEGSEEQDNLTIEMGNISGRGPTTRDGRKPTKSAPVSFWSRAAASATSWSALRYRELAYPSDDSGMEYEAGPKGIEGKDDPAMGTESIVDHARVAVDVKRKRHSILGFSLPVRDASSSLRYENLTSPCNGSDEFKEEVVGNDAVELAIDMDGSSVCGATYRRARSKSSTGRCGESLLRAGQLVRHEEGREEQRTEGSSELVVAEDKESGELQRGTYWEYLGRAAAVWQLVAILLSIAGGQVLTMSVTVWLAHWSHQTKEEQQRSRYLVVLILLVLAATVVSLMRAVIAFVCLVKASHRLHDCMLQRIVGAPILFFDSNPTGRILNRFTKDIDFMDNLLPMTMYDFTVCIFMVLGGTLLILVVNPWVVLSLLPPAWYFWYIHGFYHKTSRQVKRLDAVTRSPVYSQLSETLDGLVTIRAFGMQRRFLRRFTERVDLNSRAYFACLSTARWLGFRLHLVMSIILTASCFSSVAVNKYSGTIHNGLLGAALMYVIQLGGLFQLAVKQSAELENQMVSAERVLKYCKVPQEGNLRSEPDTKPPFDWPAKGDIEIRDMFMRYRDDLPPALKGLSLSIPGGSRVGVVGRTGAGKSSLIAALFRLVEYDRDRGGVEIDGVDISKLGLHDLRPKMSVVPQTPFLFSGSMRLNLDPFKTQSDVEMWAALEAVQMKRYVQALPEGLDAPVSEGGGNLSVGQRQLLCLARAVLQRSQILVMDEATANIDQNTDSLIQEVVRTRFKGRTVIMIAHRLNTVIDCEQVVVISEGRVVEAGHPHILLQASAAATAAAEARDSTVVATGQASHVGMSTAGTVGSKRTHVAPNATFSSMVDEAGPAGSQNLRVLAKQAWETLESIYKTE